MLKSFTVSNFKAFEKSVTLDFSTTGNYAFNTEAIKNGIVKTSVMYGKNASGKSSIGLAVFDIVANLTDNYVNNNQYLNYKNLRSNIPFSSFKYVFTFDNTDITYSYTKQDIRTIISEKLEIGTKTVIEYDRQKSEDSITFNMAGAENLRVELRKLPFSALRFVRQNVILADTQENKLFHTFYSFVDKMLLFWSLETRGFTGYTAMTGQPIVSEIVKRGHFEELKQFFKDAGYEDELTHKTVNGSEQLLIKYPSGSLDFFLASSSGMSSLLLLYYWLEDISDPAKCPSFIFIDEFDAFYHFELSKFIIEKLKTYDCQVLLTTHNTSVFSNDLLRPDCYYICSKDKIENAHNATNKEIRLGHNLEKLYRGGTFGK